jgi:His-Xaa-Ser system protein HxsD
MATGELVLQDGKLQGTLDLRVYRLTAIKKAAYRLAHRCTATIGGVNGDEVWIALDIKGADPEANADAIRRAFLQELVDQELREQVAEETAPLRALILAQAFSNTDLIKTR